MKYFKYNREERNICAHLFRLLHERLELKSNSPLGFLLNKLNNVKVNFFNGETGLENLNYDNIGIYCEVALIRDAYFNRKPDVEIFLDEICKLVIKQEDLKGCRMFSELDRPLNDISKTHPKQIRQKAEKNKILLTNDELILYGSLQGMFNAKPDLVITIDDKIIVFEAKFTELFKDEQLNRTKNVAEVWSKLLYKDLGFESEPKYAIIKLGPGKFNPQISWSDILQISQEFYKENDLSLIALKSAHELLSTLDKNKN